MHSSPVYCNALHSSELYCSPANFQWENPFLWYFVRVCHCHCYITHRYDLSLSDLTVTVISGTQSSLIAPHKKKWAQMVEMAHLYLFIFVFLSGIHCDHFLHSCWIIRGKATCYVCWIVHFISLHCKMHINTLHCVAIALCSILCCSALLLHRWSWGWHPILPSAASTQRIHYVQPLKRWRCLNVLQLDATGSTKNGQIGHKASIFPC